MKVLKYSNVSRYLIVYGTLRSRYNAKNNFFTKNNISYTSLGEFLLKGIQLVLIENIGYPFAVIKENSSAVVELIDLSPNGFDLNSLYVSNYLLDVYEGAPQLYNSAIIYPSIPVLGTIESKIYIWNRALPEKHSVITDFIGASDDDLPIIYTH